MTTCRKWAHSLRQRSVDRTLDPNRPAVASTSSPSSESPSSAPSAVPHNVTQPLARIQPIGRYLIDRTLSKSASSAVYAATEPESERVVAIKVLPIQEGSAIEAQRIRRLQREAEILARSPHPNLIRVFEFGTEKDRSFLVMELLENSVTLTRWMEQQPRTWQEVMGLFIQAGNGLAAAHRAGVVHRDFKADNVLVGEDGRARVTDFGHLSSRTDERGVEVVDGMSAEKLDAKLERAKQQQEGPMYFAPEQKSGIPAGPAADQYSFCFALRLALQARNGGDPATAKRIQHVLSRGLALRPTARYPRMESLLRALEGAVRGPVWKTSPRLAIGGAAGSALVLLGLVTWAITASRAQAPVCGGEAKIDDVWSAPRKSRLQQVLSSATGADPAAVAAAVESLDEGAAALTAEMRGSCELAGDGSLGAEALAHRASCLDFRLQELSALIDVAEDEAGHRPEHLARAARELPSPKRCSDPKLLAALPEPPADPVQLAQASALHKKVAIARAWGKLGVSARELESIEAATVSARQLGDKSAEAELLYLKGARTLANGDLVKAEELLFSALEAGQASHNDEVSALAAVDLARAMADTRPDESERWLRLGVAAGSRTALGPAFEARLDLQRARMALRRKEWEKAVALAQKALPNGPRDTPAGWEARTILAESLERLGRTDDACRSAADALDAAQKLYGNDSLRTAQNLTQRARCALAAERDAEAVTLLQTALKVQQKVLGPETADVARAFASLGVVHWQLEQFNEALSTTRQALAAFEKSRGVRDPEYLDTLCKYAGMMLMSGRRDDSIRFYEKAIKGIEDVYGPKSPELAGPLTGLGKGYLFVGQYSKALSTLQAANAVSDAKRDPFARAETQFYLAKAIWTLDGDKLRAVRLAMDAAQIYRTGGESHEKQLESVETWLAKRTSQVAARR